VHDSITDVPGIQVGHAQDPAGCTGCTVVLCGPGAVGAADVRGGGPATREIDTMNPANVVREVHAVYLGGGSAFGLAGATGVVRWLEERGIGFDAGVARVPIVPGACLFDLAVGSPRARPDEAMGYEACRNAAAGRVAQGNVGAGTGASVGKAAGPGRMMKGGLGTASRISGSLVVGAIVAVNCFGDVVDPATGSVVAGTLNEAGDGFCPSLDLLIATPGAKNVFSGGNTTIGVVATNARLTKGQAHRVAIMAQDGLARAIVPVHTPWDGDTVFCLATGGAGHVGAAAADASDTEVAAIGAMAMDCMAHAIVNAVLHAEPLGGLPCCRDVRAHQAGAER